MTEELRVDNPEIVPFALHQLGGVGEFIDVEAMFVRCYELAPERFGWRRFPYPNYKSLSKALRDFEEKYPSLLLKTSDGLRRQLSREGVQWVRTHLQEFERVISTAGGNPPTRRPGQRVLNDMSAHRLIQDFLAGGQPELIKHEVADVFLCSPDSPTAVFRERLETYKAVAEEGGRQDLLRFLDFVETQKPEWFKEG